MTSDQWCNVHVVVVICAIDHDKCIALLGMVFGDISSHCLIVNQHVCFVLLFCDIFIGSDVDL